MAAERASRRRSGPAPVRARLEQLEAQRVVERARRGIAVNRRVHSGGHTTVRPEMATFEQLSPEQRAIVELVLRQGKTYGELSDMLNLPEGRVRELARDALVELAPVSVRGVEEDWRGQLADYVLGQQSGPEATATQGPPEALRGGPQLGPLAARLARAVLRERLGAGDPGGRARPPRRAQRPRAEPREPRSAMGGRLAPTADRRWLLAGAAALIVSCWRCSSGRSALLTGGDDDSSKSTRARCARRPPAAVHDRPAGQNQPGAPAGIAIVVERNGKKQLLVQAARLTPSGQSQGY